MPSSAFGILPFYLLVCKIPAAFAAMESPLVELNVGGKVFLTLRTTLTSRPMSLLTSMLNPEFGAPSRTVDAQGRIFIDRCSGGAVWPPQALHLQPAGPACCSCNDMKAQCRSKQSR